MSTSSAADIRPLVALAHCLARPVQRGWISLELADAALVLAVCRLDAPPGLDVLAEWHDMRDVLRQEVFR